MNSYVHTPSFDSSIRLVARDSAESDRTSKLLGIRFYAYVSQLAEESVLETECCAFDSHRRYHLSRGAVSPLVRGYCLPRLANCGYSSIAERQVVALKMSERNRLVTPFIPM